MQHSAYDKYAFALPSYQLQQILKLATISRSFESKNRDIFNAKKILKWA